jgi:formiminotetrahydrofolate cyclodeaminase
MVTELTIGRARYAASEQQMIYVRERAETMRRRLTALVDEDAQAYQDLLSQYTLPKGTDADDALRTSAIQWALLCATEPPLETAEACREVIELAAIGSMLGNRNAASDAAVAAMLAHAGLRCAAASVATNLRSLRDSALRSATKAHLRQLQIAGDAALERALAAVSLGD